MQNTFNQLPQFYQGIIYIFLGSLVLLGAIGIIAKGITVVIIGCALYLILLGLQKVGLFRILGLEKKLHLHK